MSPGNAFLGLNAIVFAGLGLAGLFAPEAVMAGVGVELTANSSLVDLRATYGGAMLGIALFLASCMGGTQVRTGVAAVFWVTGGFLAGRLIGMAQGDGPALMWQLAVFEVIWCVLAAVLWLRYPAQQAR